MSGIKIAGKIVNHDEVFTASISIDPASGLIQSVDRGSTESDLDIGDSLIFPGFIDLHVHAREDESGQQNYKEDLAEAPFQIDG